MHARQPLEKRLFLRGRVWAFFGYDHRGKRYQASTHQTEWKAALGAARKIENERAAPPADAAANKKAEGFTLGQALGLLAAHDARVNAAPNTIAYHLGRGGHLLRLFGKDKPCADIDLPALKAYSDSRLAEEPDRHTIQHEHRVLRHALRLAKDDGFYLGDPRKLKVEGFVKAKGLRGFYKPGAEWLERVEWIDALVAHTSSNPDKHRVDRRDDVLVLVNIGARRREPLLIYPHHVDLQARTVAIKMPRLQRRAKRKTGVKTDSSERVLPLNDVMVEVFSRRLRHAKPGEPLFTNWGSGNRDLKSNWRRARLWLLDQCGSKRERAELDAVLPTSLTFNGLRRTFCSLMKNAGVSKESCAELLGHDDTAMVDLVYGHTAMDTLHKAVAQLPEMHVPPEELRPRTKGLSRRHRQRLRAASRGKTSDEKCPSDPGTGAVLGAVELRKRPVRGAI